MQYTLILQTAPSIMPGRKYKPGIYSKRATVMVHLTDEMRRRREDKASGLPTVHGQIEGLQEVQAPDVFYDAASTWLSAGPSSSTVATAKAPREDYNAQDVDNVDSTRPKASSLETAFALFATELPTPDLSSPSGASDIHRMATTQNGNIATATSAGMMEALWQIFDAAANPPVPFESDQGEAEEVRST
jgi:hypothetical protein